MQFSVYFLLLWPGCLVLPFASDQNPVEACLSRHRCRVCLVYPNRKPETQTEEVKLEALIMIVRNTLFTL